VAPPRNPEGAVHDKPQDCRSTSVTASLRLCSSVDAGQVRFNQESTERQYNLAGKAQSLGWSPERIRTLDRDLGQSGARMTGREDFKTLVSDVALGQVGAIFSLEASRLARSNQDWHRLLELCAITGTLVIDEDGCYDPADFNDGLVLGMKGTFAQAELHIIRARLHGGKLNKAKVSCISLCLSALFSTTTRLRLMPTRKCRVPFEWYLNCSNEKHGLCRGATLPATRPALSASVVRRRLERQTALGPPDPFEGARHPGEPILRRHLRVWTISSLQADWADRRGPHSVLPHATG
jgi:resolvase-like protein